MNSFELRIESSFYSIHQMQTLTSAGHTILNEIIRTQEKSTEKKQQTMIRCKHIVCTCEHS